MSRSVQILLFEVFFFQVVLLVKNSWCLQRLSLVTTKRCKATNKVLKSLKWILLCFYRAIFATFFWQRGGFILLVTAAPSRTKTREKNIVVENYQKSRSLDYHQKIKLKIFAPKLKIIFFGDFQTLWRPPLLKLLEQCAVFPNFFLIENAVVKIALGKKIVSNAQKEEKYDIKIT